MKYFRLNIQQLMKVYGNFMWNLSQIFETFQPLKVYIGSFSLYQAFKNNFQNFIDAECKILLQEIYDLPKTCLLNKINNFIQRSQLAIVIFNFTL